MLMAVFQLEGRIILIKDVSSGAMYKWKLGYAQREQQPL